MNKEKTRASLYGIVAAYLLYNAYGLWQGRGDPDTTMKPWVAILFIVLFAVCAAGLLALAWRTWRRSKDEDASQEDTNSLNKG